MKSWLRLAVCAAVFTALAACGFALRGTTPLPFKTLYVGVAENTLFGSNLRRAIMAASPQTRLVQTPKEADAQLVQVSNVRNLREVSLDAQGRVEQYELSLVFTFRVVNAKGLGLLPDTTLSAAREVPYNDQILQAKEGEFDTIFRNMQQSLIDRIVRRLTAPEIRDALRKAENDNTAADLPTYSAVPEPGIGSKPQTPTPLTPIPGMR